MSNFSPIKEWPADNIERRAVSTLVPYARNARTHSPEQVDQLAASIREWGWTSPVLVDEDGTIIAGHGRVLAAQKLGIADVPAMVARGWTDAQRRAYVLADNQLALNAGWDTAMLKVELGDLQAGGFDLGLIGFGDALGALLAPAGTEGLTDPDDAPAVQDVVVSAPGDLWVLGHHRLICGSSTDAHTVERVLDGVKPHLMVTDPPYGVEYDADWRNKAMRSDGTPVAGRAVGQVLNDDKADWREAWALFPGAVAYVWHGGLHAHTVHESLLAAGFQMRAQVIWAKTRFAISRGHYHWQHEPCWVAERAEFEPDHETLAYAVRKGSAGSWEGGRKQSTLWTIEHVKSETGHSTQKPIECMRRPMENNSSPGQAVYEPFSGSGSTIIAGETCGRAVHAVELNPAYVDVAVRRWEAFTGQPAILADDGRSFGVIAAQRAA